jgi:hypothetical protein
VVDNVNCDFELRTHSFTPICQPWKKASQHA